jgi:hypothetical protein
VKNYRVGILFITKQVIVAKSVSYAHPLSSNIKNGVTLFGVAGDPNVVDTSSGDAVATEILTGKKAWVAGIEVTGAAQLTGHGSVLGAEDRTNGLL